MEMLDLVPVADLLFSYRNSDQMKAYWKISSISEKSENGGKLSSVFSYRKIVTVKE